MSSIYLCKSCMTYLFISLFVQFGDPWIRTICVLWAFAYLKKKQSHAYLLGLLAMIKCSICSYQSDIWYTDHVSVSLSLQFFLGELGCRACTSPFSRVPTSGTLALGANPFGGTSHKQQRMETCCGVFGSRSLIAKRSLKFSFAVGSPSKWFAPWEMMICVGKSVFGVYAERRLHSAHPPAGLCSYYCQRTHSWPYHLHRRGQLIADQSFAFY